ncbi:MAG: ATPase [Candidatus Diapherotrites archaeon]|uniref:ATPase n=1 Tax=Candidatus Iainarchaeum sp. TaxID=3101447 RepID=A0A2D6LQ16_9ARCH|nr:ATPase [Candidatus Diapherotrites archaeon]|tara:strand:- start:29285 stop:30022 length:738 start_codon:yes stop_codon:yes gene_type:complete
MNRIQTGINGLDKLIEGGFPEGRTTLVSGACGTGKTIFCAQYLYEGASKYKEPGIYVTLDERPELIRQDMQKFGWDLRKLEDDNMIQIIDGSLAKIGIPSEEEFAMPATGFDIDKLLLEIMRTTKKIGAKRLVIDSIPAMGMNYESENEIRNAILKLSYLLMRIGVTTLLTSEVTEGENKFGKYGIEEYVVDGVIVLHYMGIGTRSNRTLHIRKMRATKHSEDLHPIEIDSKGMNIKKVDKEYDV